MTKTKAYNQRLGRRLYAGRPKASFFFVLTNAATETCSYILGNKVDFAPGLADADGVQPRPCGRCDRKSTRHCGSGNKVRESLFAIRGRRSCLMTTKRQWASRNTWLFLFKVRTMIA